MNILLLSVGTRNKVVAYFKKALLGKGKLIATDMSNVAPAIYEADSYYIVPKITDDSYIDVILDICIKEKINGVLSLIDPELSLLAKNEEKFKKNGVTIIGSSFEACEMSLDKMKMFSFCTENGFACAKSWVSLSLFKEDLNRRAVSFPVFVKPQNGSASLSVVKVNDVETLEFYFKRNVGLMIQEFLDGQEIGADVYIDTLSGNVINIFTKKKILMRAGETDKAVSFKDPKLFELIEKFVKRSGYRGQIDIDIFNVKGKYYISEVNPRFGGGYPHAYESGCNSIDLIINNLNGIVNEKDIGNYQDGVVMMKYNDVKIITMDL